jgi:hypothetical protein
MFCEKYHITIESMPQGLNYYGQNDNFNVEIFIET